MATVDASIGIKTAVNFHDKKNKLGTYCPPLGVFYDLSFLQTLEARHLSNGSAEILKMACIKDEVLFQMLEQHADDLLTSHYQVCMCAGHFSLQYHTLGFSTACKHCCNCLAFHSM